MNPIPPNNDDPRPADPAFDDLIRGALGDEPPEASDPLRLARLEEQWRRGQRKLRTRRRVAWGASLAAAATLLVVLTLPRDPARVPSEESLVAQAQPPEGEGPDRLAATDSIDPAPPQPPTSAGRPPTDYERWMFAAQTRTQVVLAPPERPTLPQELRRVLDGEPIDLLRGHNAERVESQLLAAVARPADEPRALDVLTERVGYAGWPRLVGAARVPATREALIQHLLLDASEPALVAYLRLVHDGATRDDALAAADQLDGLPIAELVGLVDHRDATVRLAASLALGRLNRCEMTDALISRVSQRPSRSKEAWFALFGCQCDTASTFLNYAAQSPKLIGQLNNARIQWTRVITP